MAVALAEGAGPWRALGLLTFLDPPRPDTRDTLEKALGYGVDTKMARAPAAPGCAGKRCLCVTDTELALPMPSGRARWAVCVRSHISCRRGAYPAAPDDATDRRSASSARRRPACEPWSHHLRRRCSRSCGAEALRDGERAGARMCADHRRQCADRARDGGCPGHGRAHLHARGPARAAAGRPRAARPGEDAGAPGTRLRRLCAGEYQEEVQWSACHLCSCKHEHDAAIAGRNRSKGRTVEDGAPSSLCMPHACDRLRGVQRQGRPMEADRVDKALAAGVPQTSANARAGVAGADMSMALPSLAAQVEGSHCGRAVRLEDGACGMHVTDGRARRACRCGRSTST